MTEFLLVILVIPPQARTSLDCAHKCLKYSASSGQQCNAFSFSEDTNTCELANINSLEDPLHDG